MLLRQLRQGNVFAVQNKLSASSKDAALHLPIYESGGTCHSGLTTGAHVFLWEVCVPPRTLMATTVFGMVVSTFLLFQNFREAGRPVTVGGLACRDRLEALQRTFEHELLNLAEKDRALKAELDKQGAKEQTGQQEKAYGR